MTQISDANKMSRPLLSDGSINVLYLRFVELFSYFFIAFIAKVLAGFNYPSTVLVVGFLTAAILHYNAKWIWTVVGRSLGWSDEQTHNAVLWHSSYIDLASVLGLIYFTGTIESPFLILLTIPLFFACNTFSWRVTVKYFLSVAMITVAALGLFELRSVIPHYSCYWFETEAFQNLHYLIGSLMVVGAFVSLVIFLSNTFQGRLKLSVDTLRNKGRESENKIHELARLYDITLGINAAMSMDTLLKIVAKEVTLLLKQPWASVVLFNANQEVTHTVFVGVNQNQEMNLGKKIRRGGLSEWIWTHNTPILVEDAAKDKRANCSDFIARFGIRAIMGFPLTSGKQVIGVIFTGDFQPKSFDEHQLRLLTTLSTQLSAAIEKSSLHESLERKIRSLGTQIGALEKVSALKSDFVMHVSHELRTPLTSIKAYVETLCSHVNDPNFTHNDEFLNVVSKETDRLIRIVNQILDVSKIEFGHRPLAPSVFALTETIEDVVSMLLPSLEEKQLTLEVNVPDSLPKIDADIDLIQQVLINLISNAVKYSPENTCIEIEAGEGPVDLWVSVSDQGIGIPAAELDHVFDKYFRVRSEKNNKFEGVGLGLAITKNIIEQHGGTIRVESQEAVGSKFYFSLPKEHAFNDLIGYIGEVVDAKNQLHEMLELIVKMIAELLSTKHVSLMLLDKTRSELFIKMSYGLDEWIVKNARVKLGEGIAGKVAETGEPLFIQNIEDNKIFSCPNSPQYETQSLVSVPLIVNGMVVGVINVNNKTNHEPFSQDDVNLLLSFSERISRALERVRVVEDSRAFLEDTIEAFKRMLENQTRTKIIEKVIRHAVKVARKIDLSEKEVSVIQYVASVHDIGMTEVSDDILNKTLSLTSEEVKRIQQHPQRGAELIRPLEFVELVVRRFGLGVAHCGLLLS